MEKILEPLTHQYYMMLKALHQHHNCIRVGTLGPDGTSSVNTAQYLLENMRAFESNKVYDLRLFDTFSQLLNAANHGEIDFALVPSASDRVTDFFWSQRLENCFNFLYPTPGYVLVRMPSYKLQADTEVIISTCTAVKHMIHRFAVKELQGFRIKRLITPSTTKALEALIAGKADLAITNETSIQKYHVSVAFVSDIQYAQIMWCLFCPKADLIEKGE